MKSSTKRAFIGLQNLLSEGLEESKLSDLHYILLSNEVS